MRETSPDAPFAERVYAIVSRVPYGRVSTYGDIAALLGHPRAARGVGRALSQLPQGVDVPWWRIVNRSGELSIPHMGRLMQRMLLRQEGVRFRSSGNVDLRSFRWAPRTEEVRLNPAEAHPADATER